MGTIDNQNNLQDNSFQNFNYLPQKLFLEDLDKGIYNFFRYENQISTIDPSGRSRRVPVIWTSQELWAERKQNFPFLEDENGEEIGRPFIAIYRDGVDIGTSPQRYTIPTKKKFKYVRVPIFDGTLKGFEVYKVPQPKWVDLQYQLIFETHYQQQVNLFYEMLYRDAYSDGQGYISNEGMMNINGYYIPSKLESTSEDDTVNDISSEQIFRINATITVHGKLVDPSQFEKVQTVTKIAISIEENEC